ncbi:MAG: MoaD/ThiS family protein [Candidatus Thorarchaeota archaeon]
MHFIKGPLILSEWKHIMRITLQFRGPLAKKLKDGKIEIELDDDSCLSDLLNEAIKREKNIREVWDTPQIIDRDALVLRNEADVALSGGLETKLCEGDVVVVLPLIHGG